MTCIRDSAGLLAAGAGTNSVGCDNALPIEGTLGGAGVNDKSRPVACRGRRPA
jgi:hypothetical protein